MTITEPSKLNNKVFSNINITSQENNIIKSFENFYQNNEYTDIFLYLISSKSIVSIRLIDHFVTKYAKNYKTNYKLKENNVEQIFNVYTSYKQQLKAYQKKYFDPFSRGERIPFFINDICIITTIGQLNFFKWFVSKKINDYILVNQNIIENDMNQKYRIKTNIKVIKKNIKPKIITQPINQLVPNYTSSYNCTDIKKRNENIIVSFSFN
jgi:hypothetical protein